LQKTEGFTIEIKQLRYFVTAAECGSINKAAEQLYTTQPNVSKIVRSLEKELGCDLFKRTSHGLLLTQRGQKLFYHARTVLRGSELMFSIAKGTAREHLGVASYPSNMISHVLTDYYNQCENCEITMELLEGASETVVEHVERYRCEIGVLYVGHNLLGTLSHWLGNKKMEFHSITQKRACIYVGPNHPFYERKTIKASELIDLKFIQPFKDYFSAENYMDTLNPALTYSNAIHPAAITNSDHATISFLSKTDLCSFGIFLLNPSCQENDIRAVQIEGAEKNLHLGYVKRMNTALSIPANEFINMLTEFIKSCD
jgi:DNA-binding transcriptional LysR family regulator